MVIKRSSTVGSMAATLIFTAIAIALIRREMPLLAIQGTMVIDPFTREALSRCVPYLIFLCLLSLTVSSLKLYWARWNIPLCIANVIHNVVWLGIALPRLP